MLYSRPIGTALKPQISLLLVALCACSSASSSPDPGLGADNGGVLGGTTMTYDAGGAPATTAGESIGTTGPDFGSSGTAQPGTGGQVGSTGTGGQGDGGMVGPVDGPGDVSGLDGGETGGGGPDDSGAVTDPNGEADASLPAVGCEVSPITDEMRRSYREMDAPYYEKFASANGVVVATGPNVDNEAITRYCLLLTEMFSNDDVRQALIADKMWFTMIAEEEQLSSLPQINRDYGTAFNRRARGLGGLTPTICAEDSIMCMPGDPWVGDCICPHETGHTLYSSAIARVPELSRRLTSITDSVRSSGRLANAYVWMDGDESGMMAWGAQVWYDCAIDGSNGGYHSDINTRAELEKELPDFYQFLSEIMPSDNQYEDCYAEP